jgi:hypothetical protein
MIATTGTHAIQDRIIGAYHFHSQATSEQWIGLDTIRPLLEDVSDYEFTFAVNQLQQRGDLAVDRSGTPIYVLALVA